jgi:hypothetical protein
MESNNPQFHSRRHGEEQDQIDDKIELGHPDNSLWSAGEMENLKVGGGVDPVFEAKASIINSALQHIGMGKYQWKLFALCGFGWVPPPFATIFPK